MTTWSPDRWIFSANPGERRENLISFRRNNLSLNLKKNESDGEKNMFSDCTIDIHSFPILSTPTYVPANCKIHIFSTYKSLVFTYPYWSKHVNDDLIPQYFHTEIAINHRCYNFQVHLYERCSVWVSDNISLEKSHNRFCERHVYYV